MQSKWQKWLHCFHFSRDWSWNCSPPLTSIPDVFRVVEEPSWNKELKHQENLLLQAHPWLWRGPLRVALAGEDWTTFVTFFKAEEKSYTLDGEKKIRRGLNALCEYQPRAYLIGSGMLGSWDGSIWLQEDSLCLPEMLVAHGSDMSYMCRCKLTYESKELLLLIAHIEGREWRMLLNCQI